MHYNTLTFNARSMALVFEVVVLNFRLVVDYSTIKFGIAMKIFY